ncbi:MAG: hypothetical protein ACJASV_002815 [Pseudorhodobacter sp.]
MRLRYFFLNVSLPVSCNGVDLILGSGPNVLQARDWNREAFARIIAINNAWQVRPDWSDAIFPWDFPIERRPAAEPGKRLITQEAFVPAQNIFGGFVYAGGTMAFTAAYWALATQRPRVLAMMGCDMHYPKGQTHFYGSGTADPLRDDITLQSLEAKSARLLVKAAEQGCAMVNLSQGPSRLIFQKVQPKDLDAVQVLRFDPALVARAVAREQELDYYVPSGRYWDVVDRFDAAALRDLDAMWLGAAQSGLNEAR